VVLFGEAEASLCACGRESLNRARAGRRERARGASGDGRHESPPHPVHIGMQTQTTCIPSRIPRSIKMEIFM